MRSLRHAILLASLSCLSPSASFAQSASSQLTPSSLSFPTVSVGATSNAEVVVLNNYGASAVAVSAITVTGPFTVDKSNCGTSVASGTQCYVYVRAAPTAAGLLVGILSFTTSAGNNTVKLNGTTLPINTTSTVLNTSGAAGAYTLTGTVPGTRGTGFPTGPLSFLDTTNGNLSLGAPTLVPGTATFGLSSFTAGPVGDNPDAIATGDFNGDGKLDLVVANGGVPGCGTQGFPCPNSLSILLGNGDGTFTVSTITGINNAGGVAVADFNGDGKLDLAVTDGNDYKLIVLLGKGDGTFTKLASAPAMANYPYAIATGDFNGDGKADLAIVNQPSGLSVLLGNGDGTFTVKSSPTTDGDPVALVLGDFNGDGKLDIAVACYGNYIAGTISPTIDIFLGTGTGTFTNGIPISAGSSTLGGGFGTIAVGDFNGDKKLDLASFVRDSVTNNLSVVTFLGNGNGTFIRQAPLVTSDDIEVATIGIADFDGDGKPDISIANYNHYSIFPGNGDGTFKAPVSVPGSLTGPNYITQAIGDFNGDGLPDLAIADGDLSIVRLQLSTRSESSSATLTGVSIPGSGTHAITASYAGDTNFAASTSAPASLTASPLATTLALLATPATVTYGGQVALQATLSPYVSGNLKTDGETITFTSGATTLGTATLATGVARLNLTSLPVGTDSITASYPGDASFLLTSAAATQVVVSASAPTLTLSPTSLAFASQTIATASAAQTVTITNTGTSSLTISSITASGDFAVTGSCPTVAAAATCTLSITFTPTASGARASSLTLVDNATGSPQTVALTGTGAALATRLTLTASPTTVLLGAQVALQTTLTPNASGTLKTDGESITFTSGSATLGTATLAAGVATLNLTSLPVGTSSITASYAGDANFSAATAAATQVIVTSLPTLTLSPTSLTFATQTSGVASAAQNVTITNTGTSPLLISSVTASGDFTVTGSCSTVAAAATCPLSVIFTPTASGTRTGTLTLVDNAASSPQTVALTGTGAPITVTVAVTSLTIASPGASASTTLQITPAGGFSGSVTLACVVNFQGTGTPTTPPTCALSPSPLTVTPGTPASTTLTISTTAAHAALTAPAFGNSSRTPALAFAGLLMLGLLPLRRRRNARLLMLFVAAATIAGCSSGSTSSSSTSSTGTTLGTYQVVVTSTANSVVTNTTLSLNVQ